MMKARARTTEAAFEPRVTLITLGVDDLACARAL
jgi:hypothetical protein